MERKEESAALNLLKIVMMFLVVGMHYLSHSGFLTQEEPLTGTWCGVYLIRSFFMVCVNCFVLVTGYYMSEREMICKEKVFGLADAMLFYSIIISLILCFLGMTDFSAIQMVYTLFPFCTKSYWFMTCYIVLYLLSSYINQAVKGLSEKDFTKTLLAAVLFFSVIPTVFNSFASTLDDTNGFSIPWFVVLYLTGAWVKKTQFCFKKCITAPALYIICSMAVFLITFMVEKICSFGVAQSYKGYGLSYIGYNYLFVYLASIGCFLMFRQMKIKNSILCKCVAIAAPLTGGGYLIAEHPQLREILFDEVLHCDKYVGKDIFWVNMIAVTAGVYVACLGIEWIRMRYISKYFKPIQKSCTYIMSVIFR